MWQYLGWDICGYSMTFISAARLQEEIECAEKQHKIAMVGGGEGGGEGGGGGDGRREGKGV